MLTSLNMHFFNMLFVMLCDVTQCVSLLISGPSLTHIYSGGVAQLTNTHLTTTPSIIVKLIIF